MKQEKESLVKGQTTDAKLSGNLYWYVFVLSLLAPIVASSVFYYGWKKTMPIKAKNANNVGWLAILVLIIGRVAFVSLF
jgi:hypothetical protein